MLAAGATHPSTWLRAAEMSTPATTLGAFCAVLLATQACAETRRANGDECLKDDDCLSGICSQLVCAPAPTQLDAEPDSTLETDAAADVIDAMPDVAEEVQPDAPADGSGDGDAPHDQ
jgi:hypothetical protein